MVFDFEDYDAADFQEAIPSHPEGDPPLLALAQATTPRRRPTRSEGVDRLIDVLGLVRGGELHPDAGLALRHDGVREADDIDALGELAPSPSRSRAARRPA